MQHDARNIQKRQDALLKEMGRIRVMRRGTLSKQEYKGRKQRKNGAGATGPYFVWQGSVDGKRFCVRVGAQQAQRMEQEIAQRHKFEALCGEVVALGEALAKSLCNETEDTIGLKKRLKSRPSKAKKSHA